MSPSRLLSLCAPLQLWGPPPVSAPCSHPTSVNSCPSSCVRVPVMPCSLASRVCSLSFCPSPACTPLSAWLCLSFPSLSSRFCLSQSLGVSLFLFLSLHVLLPQTLFISPYLSPSLPVPLLLPFPDVLYTSIVYRFSPWVCQSVHALPCCSAHHSRIPPAGGASGINQPWSFLGHT